MDRMKNKIERLNHLLNDLQPSIVVLTEHGLKQEVIKNARLTHYNLVSAYGRSNHIKGGVAIYKHCKLTNDTESLNVEEFSEEMFCEVSAIKIQLNKKNCLNILGVYRPPNTPLDSMISVISESLDKLSTQNSDIFIIGDLNVDCLDNNPRNEIAKKTLTELLAQYGINRMQLPPTRITIDTISSIDAVCSTMDLHRINVEILHTGLSDHSGQCCTIDLLIKTGNTPKATYRQMNQNNLLQLQQLLKEENWESSITTNNVDDAYNQFSATLGMLLNNACPYKKKSQTSKPRYVNPIFNEETKRLKEEFLEAQKIFILSGSENDRALTARTKKAYDLKLKQLRQQASAEFILNSNNKSKAIWEVINSERKSSKEKSPSISLLISGGERIKERTAMANSFNSYFASMAQETLSNQQRSCIETHNQPLVSTMTNFQPATTTELSEIIKSLKPKSSAGIDGIPPKIFKFCEEELSSPILNIINKSLSQGIFPSRLKTAKIFPKFKQGEKTDVSNYRPISLLPTASKIIEKLVLKRLLDHLNQNNILTKHQHGFTKGKSTTTALIEFSEFIIDNIEAGNTITSVYLDLSKAFDCLGHDLIINNLSGLGVKGTALKWFESYLRDRIQIVELHQIINNVETTACSTPLTVNRGVPQGSVLGPVLFILLTNDLPSYMGQKMETIMYADDTVLLNADSNIEQLEIATYVAVNMAQQYCSGKDLVFNEKKTKQMSFGKKSESISQLPNLQDTDTVKHLGVLIDNNMSWNSHTDALCLKLSSAIYAISRTKKVNSLEATKTTYYALFESQLRYGIVVWGSSSAGNLHRILIQQKRAIRVIAGIGPRDTCRNLFKDLGILTVTSIYILEAILHCVRNNLQRNEDLHTYLTRHANDFALPRHRTATFEKKPTYAGIKMFNALPRSIKTCTIKTMKTTLKNWLLNNSFYTLEEFFHWREPPV